jgi:DNA (cytosine-5)-methyltransferase 1
VLADLESEGYAGRAIVVPACAVNAPHRRDRVWIIARDMADSGSGRRQGGELQAGRNEPGLCGTDVAHSEIERTQGLRASGVEESPAYAGQEVPLCGHERIGSSYWETEPDVLRVVDGLPSRVDRLRGLGNAIVPQVAYELIRHLETDG